MSLLFRFYRQLAGVSKIRPEFECDASGRNRLKDWGMSGKMKILTTDYLMLGTISFPIDDHIANAPFVCLGLIGGLLFLDQDRPYMRKRMALSRC